MQAEILGWRIVGRMVLTLVVAAGTAGTASCQDESRNGAAVGDVGTQALSGCRKNLAEWLEARVDLLENPLPDNVKGWLETSVYSGVPDVYVSEEVLGWLAALVNNRQSADDASVAATTGLAGAGALIKVSVNDQSLKDHKGRLKVWLRGRVAQLNESTPWLQAEKDWLQCDISSITMGGPDPDDPMPPPPVIGGLSRLFVDKVGATDMSAEAAETLGNEVKAALAGS